MFSNSLMKSLWLLLAALLIMLGNGIPFPLLVFLSFVVLATPLFMEFRRCTDLDERQIQISHFSSHIAYFVFLFLLGLGLINEWMIKGQTPEPILFILFFVPIGAKAIICLFQNYGSVSGVHGFMRLFFRGIVPEKSTIDERQHIIGNFSSHIAFYIYMILLVTWLLFKFFAAHKNPGDNLWYALLLVPLLIKFYVSLFKNYGAGTGARIISFIILGILFLFTLLSHGISLEMIIEATPFLILAAIVLLSYRFPKTSGGIFILLGVGSLIFFNWHGLYDRLLMGSIIPLPLILSGSALLTEKNLHDEN
jgi:hypothetical protein